jgi:hypothetical protein
MKKSLLYFLFCLFPFLLVAQQPVADGITYQAVAIDNDGKEIAGMDINGNILHSKKFFVKFTIIEDNPEGTIMYQEIHDTYTDHNGLFSVVIGRGEITNQSLVQSLLDVNWGEYKHFLQIDIDLKKDGNFKKMGVQQMMAVPYAFYAMNASRLTGVNDTSNTNEIQQISIINDTLFLSSGGGYIVLPEDKVNDADADPTNELQNIGVDGTMLNITGGNSIDLTGVITDVVTSMPNIDTQTLTINGSILTISNGNSVDIIGATGPTGPQGLQGATGHKVFKVLQAL